MEFPERVFTEEEVKRAKELVDKGYKHRLSIVGSAGFKRELEKALKLIKTAGYHDFLRTYIRQIQEIEGFSQLHEADVVIWANMPMLADSVDAASYIVQKAQQMKDYLEGKLYYGTGEMSAIQKRLEFLEKLKEKTESEDVKKRCEKLLKEWSDTTMMFP
jgi:CRISPR/Cas system-associated endonuclease Cas3-HD